MYYSRTEKSVHLSEKLGSKVVHLSGLHCTNKNVVYKVLLFKFSKYCVLRTNFQYFCDEYLRTFLLKVLKSTKGSRKKSEE